MNALLIYPKYPDTFYSFKHALKFISKKAANPPLGLATVAALLPDDWVKRLVDMNVTPLKDADLAWADIAFIGAMSIQQSSARETAERCRAHGVRAVAGGPLFTTGYEGFEGVDHFVLNEAEVTLPQFLEDLAGGCARRTYTSSELPDIGATPAPLWDLLDFKSYASMGIQYSRGCPFNCDFCNISILYGRKVRTKHLEQLLIELDRLYACGWRGDVFFVDDNFIGNKQKLKNDILPGLIRWMECKGHPFTFNTEASIDLSDDSALMDLMVRAGFTSVFVGIESPNEESLEECRKVQNKKRDLIACVRRIRQSGLAVAGGFIVGFDSDPPSIFDRLSAFIQESGIVSAMVGVLNAPQGTALYRRLKKEGRLLNEPTGDNTDFTINFIPKMDPEKLMNGYREIIQRIYAPKPYTDRVIMFLKGFKPLKRPGFTFRFHYIEAFFKSVFILGVRDRARIQYWRLFFWSLFRRPRLFPNAMTFAIYGFHFRKVFEAGLLADG